MKRNPITPKPSDWLLVTVVALLALAGLDQLDEYARLRQQITANQANVARARMALASNPELRRHVIQEVRRHVIQEVRP